mmetsp:Transcript_80333/g.126827  ORF Transcript_80333/g.126827 Transcript_80333/m.126827 type:complete len:203 (-) Transcript_80333:586-1194(-)
MSPYTVWPVASVFPVATNFCPAPSATAMTMKSFRAKVESTCFKTSAISTSTSGIMTRSTMVDANAACMATNPASRPMSFTMPTPLEQLVASTQPFRITSDAAATAESKPNVLSKKTMSLSIDFGTPTMDKGMPLFLAAWKSLLAAACVPSPPTVKSILIPCFCNWSRILSGSSIPPRPAFKILPPFMWMSRTFSTVNCIGGN